VQQVPVLVDTFSSPEEIKAIRSALKSIGFEGTIERSVPPQGEAPWLVLIGMPVGAFLSGFFAAAGKDAWERFKQFFDDIKAAHEPKRRFWRRSSQARFGQLVIRPNIETAEDLEPHERAAILMGWVPSGGTSTELMLSTDLPDEALRALFDVDLSKYPNHYIFWNPDSGKWDARPKEGLTPDDAG
jgi:hypothetical protein